MPKILRAQVRILNNSGLPRDVAMNTFHFRSLSFDPLDDVDTAQAALETLYQSYGPYFSPVCDGNANITWYALDVPEPRIPIHFEAFTFIQEGSTAMPNEVAVVTSFHAAPAAGAAPGRRRGRLYMGPFNTTPFATGDFDAKVSGAALEDFITSWTTFSEAMAAGGDCRWVVFSPTTAGAQPWSESTLQDSSFDVVGGHIDNAFDTVRSRGGTADERTTFGP